MVTPEEAKSLTEEELLKRQRKGAKVTATIVAVIALGVFLFTLYMSAKS